MATATTTLSTDSHELEAVSSSIILEAQVSNLCEDTNRTNVEGDASKTSKLRTATTVAHLAIINLLSSFTNGVITVGLPIIARDISLPRELYLWPLSVSGLTCGSILLMAGSIADVIGPRRVELAGCFMLAIFTLACGLAYTGIQLTLFRAFQGVALAVHLPASVSIVTATVPKGKPRNIAFAALGYARAIGYSLGLVLSGVLIRVRGWRINFYLAGGAMLLLAIGAIWVLPAEKSRGTASEGLIKQLYHRIDLVGSIIISGGLALLAYVLAVLSADLASIRSASTYALLTVSLILMIVFPLWSGYRERHGKPALIPNSLWRDVSFTSTCIILALSYGVVIAMEQFSSLYFQEIQGAGTLTTSLQLLPNVFVGVAIGVSCGFFVDKIAARWLVTITSIMCACAPLLMALMDPKRTYWYMAFWAQALSSINVDVLSTVGMLIVSDVFPDRSQAIAGAVFNTVGMFGLSLGVGVCQLVALEVTGSRMQAPHSSDGSESRNQESPGGDISLQGYRASFWTMHGFMILCAIVALLGLRKVGRVGLKRD